MSSNIFGYSTATNFSNRLPDTAALANLVTLNTPQTITGQKTFTAPLTVAGLTATEPVVVEGLDATTIYSSGAITTDSGVTATGNITATDITASDDLIGNYVVGNITVAARDNTQVPPTSGYFQQVATTTQFIAKTTMEFLQYSQNSVLTKSLELTATSVRNLAFIGSTDNSTMVATTAWIRSIFAPTPTGTISLYGGDSATIAQVGGWVLCDGATYNGSNSTYAALFGVIGVGYTPASVVYPNFNVPDLRGIYASMPGTNSYAQVQYPGAVFEGPAHLGDVQKQSTFLVDHQHYTNYPQNSLGVEHNSSSTYHAYESGSAGQTAASSLAYNYSAPNSWTTLAGNFIKPATLGLNYIIKL